MDEQLRLYAASEAEVLDTIGLGPRDEELAERVLARVSLFAVDDLDATWDYVDLAARTLVWDGAPNGAGVVLPFDQPADCYWAALEAIVAAASWADLAVPGARAALDLDQAFAEAGTPRGPMQVAHRVETGLADPTQWDIRVVAHGDAVALAQSWLAAETPQPDRLGDFWRTYLGLGDRASAAGRPAPDLWLWTPSNPLAHRRYPDDDWPPRELVTRPLPEVLREGVSLRTSAPPLKPVGLPSPIPPDADFAPRADLDRALADEPGGTYTTGGGIAPDGWWTVKWRFSDGLVRVENRPRVAAGPRYWYGMLQGAWGERFDEALRATPFPESPDALPAADEVMHALSLGKPAILVPHRFAEEEPWNDVFALLDSVILTLAAGQLAYAVAGAAVDPIAVASV